MVVNQIFLFVGMTGFEPATTRPPDAYSNRAELHPALFCECKVTIILQTNKIYCQNILCFLLQLPFVLFPVKYAFCRIRSPFCQINEYFF